MFPLPPALVRSLVQKPSERILGTGRTRTDGPRGPRADESCTRRRGVRLLASPRVNHPGLLKEGEHVAHGQNMCTGVLELISGM